MFSQFNDIVYKLFSFQEKTDCTFWNKEEVDVKIPIIGVYHIFCINNWEILVQDQILELKKSGLMNITEKLYVSCIISDFSDVEKIKEYIGDKCCFINITFDKSVYEYPAIEFIYQKAKHEVFFVYYFHTKGVSLGANSSAYPISNISRLKENAKAWRKMMEYFIFEKYNVALNALKEYDTFGCYYREVQHGSALLKYYAGNFWWSKAEYIRQIPPLSKEQYADRYGAENWLCQGPCKKFIAFNTAAELYATPIPEFLYNDQCRWNWFSFVRFLFCHYKHLARKAIQRLVRKI